MRAQERALTSCRGPPAPVRLYQLLCNIHALSRHPGEPPSLAAGQQHWRQPSSTQALSNKRGSPQPTHDRGCHETREPAPYPTAGGELVLEFSFPVESGHR